MNDYAKYQLLISIFNTAFTCAAFIFAWWNTREKVLRSRFSGQDTRLADLEIKVGNMPSHCSGHNGHSERLDKDNERLQQFKEMLKAVEGDLKHLPTVKDLEKLYERINQVCNELSDMKADVGKISGAMPGITHVTEMMNEFLLNQGSRR